MRWGRKIQAYTFRVIQNFNSYGRFVRVESILGEYKAAIIIPESSYNKGWGDIARKIQGYLGEYVDPRFYLADKSRSYMEVAKISRWKSEINVAIGEKQGPMAEEIDNETFLSK